MHATERRVDPFEDGIDVALRVGSITHESMVARQVLSYRHVLVASPKLIGRHGLPRTPDDLQRFPCAVWGLDTSATCQWELGESVVTPDAVMVTNDYAHLRRNALAGQVLTELPPFLAADSIRAGHLVPLLVGHPMPEQHINLLYSSHRYLSAIVRAYLDFCEAQAVHIMEACQP
ncbi:substrate binding domain-containing protein [Cupriavidus sp. UYPR2.512]|uniref:substrate binding domain-containing protein n=1 Tax=Cupriavidus sp. UYPR2.512 TaxID=1080187 RepID=UPI00037D4C36|nr:substrate binding domain-containing protein [Cupriavidus sp. UYPR2.512]UIF90049.1 substrate binding domain-containing protein [Cupriavidus necator]